MEVEICLGGGRLAQHARRPKMRFSMPRHVFMPAVVIYMPCCCYITHAMLTLHAKCKQQSMYKMTRAERQQKAEKKKKKDVWRELSSRHVALSCFV